MLAAPILADVPSKTDDMADYVLSYDALGPVAVILVVSSSIVILAFVAIRAASAKNSGFIFDL